MEFLKYRLGLAVFILAISMMSAGCGDESSETEPTVIFDTKVALGESLFFDVNLSKNRTQSCATCHNPETGFVDDRKDTQGGVFVVSLGDDGFSLGDRNAPTAAYAKFSPEFHEGSRKRIDSTQPDYSGYLGGQFYDGREADLKGQAGGPPTNPIEMGMPDKASVVERLQDSSGYVGTLKKLYGDDIFDDVDAAYAAMAESIGEFEKTDLFSPFDSKYDRSLLEETDPNYYKLSQQELFGKGLFFSEEFTNCSICHQLNAADDRRETFSSYEYHNIGVPVNTSVRMANGSEVGYVDVGLLGNNAVTEVLDKGKHKVSTLRNIAVTGPYMHNGVFQELTTVLQFYDHYLIGSTFTMNPETSLPWQVGEIGDTISITELLIGQKTDEIKIAQMICFLRTLTDARYEHLIEGKGIQCKD